MRKGKPYRMPRHIPPPLVQAEILDVVTGVLEEARAEGHDVKLLDLTITPFQEERRGRSRP